MSLCLPIGTTYYVFVPSSHSTSDHPIILQHNLTNIREHNYVTDLVRAVMNTLTFGQRSIQM